LDISFDNNNIRNKKFKKAFIKVLDIEVDSLRNKSKDNINNKVKEDNNKDNEIILNNN
jgi:hypothetical protein